MDKLIKILEDINPEVDFSTENALIDGGILDSFDIVTLVAEIDDVYDVVIPAEALLPDNFNSAQAIFHLIQRLRAD